MKGSKRISLGVVLLLGLMLGPAGAAVTLIARLDKAVVLNATGDGIVTVTMTATASDGETLGDYCLVCNPKVYGPCHDADSCEYQKTLMASQGWYNLSGDYMALTCSSEGIAAFSTAGWLNGGYTFLASVHGGTQVPGPGVTPTYHALAWIVEDGGSPPGLFIDRARHRNRQAVLDKIVVLQRMVERAASAGGDTAYPRAALTVAKRMLRFESVKQAENLFSEVSVDLQRCLGILDHAIVELKRGKVLKVPTPSMKSLRLQGADFYAGREPVMLNGPVGWIDMWDDLDEVLDLGFNVMDDEVAASATSFRVAMQRPGFEGEPEAFFQPETVHTTKRRWESLEAEDANVAFLFNPSICYMPDWVYELHPETKPNHALWWGKHATGGWWGGYINAPLESPQMRKLWGTYYEGIVPSTKDDPRLLLYWLKNEPRYWSHTPRYLEMFRACLQEKYRSLETLNAAWGTSYETFAEIGWPQEDHKAGHYDWGTFHYDAVTEFFAWQRQQVKQAAPQALTSNKPQAPFMWLGTANEDVGIDYEAQAEIYEVPGFDSTQAFGDTTDIVKWLVDGGSMLLDFWQSVAPHKPFANLEQHQMSPGAAEDTPPLEYAQPAEVVFRYIQLTNWQQFFHGVRLNTFWFWFNKMEAGGHRPVTMQPTVLYANSKVALDLRRLAGDVTHFPAQSQIAIYFSKPSLLLDAGNYAPALRQVYAGLYFLDTPIGFVTDKMLSRGVDERIKLLVVPRAQYVADEVYQAIEAYALAGRQLVLVDATCLTRNEKHQPRQTAALLNLPNVRTLQSRDRDAQQYWQEFDHLFDACGVVRPIRIRDQAGRAVWKVESRTVAAGERRLVYLINMSREPRQVSLEMDGTIQRARDLITVEPVSTSALELKSFAVKFLEIE